MALRKQKDGEQTTGYQDPTDFHYKPPEMENSSMENLSQTDFHYVPPKEPIDWNNNDQSITATREIAERLGISPDELVEKPGAWIYLTEAILAWFPGTHWQGPTEYDDHEHYRRDGILEPLANLLGIKKK